MKSTDKMGEYERDVIGCFLPFPSSSITQIRNLTQYNALQRLAVRHTVSYAKIKDVFETINYFGEVLVLFSKPSQKRALVPSANPTQRLPDKTGQTHGTLRAHLCSTHALMLCSLPYRFYMRVKPTASHRFFTYVSRQHSFTLSTGSLFTTHPTARADISRSSMTGCCRGRSCFRRRAIEAPGEG